MGILLKLLHTFFGHFVVKRPCISTETCKLYQINKLVLYACIEILSDFVYLILFIWSSKIIKMKNLYFIFHKSFVNQKHSYWNFAETLTYIFWPLCCEKTLHFYGNLQIVLNHWIGFIYMYWDFLRFFFTLSYFYVQSSLIGIFLSTKTIKMKKILPKTRPRGHMVFQKWLMKTQFWKN